VAHRPLSFFDFAHGFKTEMLFLTCEQFSGTQTTYSLGLRLSESLNLRVGNIDVGRGQVHVRNGKDAATAHRQARPAFAEYRKALA
jgi:integrase